MFQQLSIGWTRKTATKTSCKGAPAGVAISPEIHHHIPRSGCPRGIRNQTVRVPRARRSREALVAARGRAQ
eukprot:1775719-Pyramimonas_sp.AAC.1